MFKICDKAEIKRFSVHVLRHTFATRCIEGGMMPKTLQKIPGHSNIGITLIYLHGLWHSLWHSVKAKSAQTL
ncbi:MAG: tyrosine-type recombinase/integrase [Lachnospiraceae bacterium]|nr:tyrosine-type recombinase/integrase [Lachnospiraceae bacterium]